MRSNDFRPEVQERRRRIRSHPLYWPINDEIKKARGNKKERAKAWGHQWAMAGYPTEWPSFADWWNSPAANERKEHEAYMKKSNAEIKAAHADWVARGMPSA